MFIEVLRKENINYLDQFASVIDDILIKYLNRLLNDNFKISIIEEKEEDDDSTFANFYKIEKDSYISVKLHLYSKEREYTTYLILPSSNPSSKQYKVSNGCTHKSYNVCVMTRYESIEKLRYILKEIKSRIEERLEFGTSFSVDQTWQLVLDCSIKSYTFCLNNV